MACWVSLPFSSPGLDDGGRDDGGGRGRDDDDVGGRGKDDDDGGGGSGRSTMMHFFEKANCYEEE